MPSILPWCKFYIIQHNEKQKKLQVGFLHGSRLLAVMVFPFEMQLSHKTCSIQLHTTVFSKAWDTSLLYTKWELNCAPFFAVDPECASQHLKLEVVFKTLQYIYLGDRINAKLLRLSLIILFCLVLRTREQVSPLSLLIFMKYCAWGNLLKTWGIQMFAAWRCGRYHRGTCHKRHMNL